MLESVRTCPTKKHLKKRVLNSVHGTHTHTQTQWETWRPGIQCSYLYYFSTRDSNFCFVQKDAEPHVPQVTWTERLHVFRDISVASHLQKDPSLRTICTRTSLLSTRYQLTNHERTVELCHLSFESEDNTHSKLSKERMYNMN